MSARVRLDPEAEEQALLADRWWRTNRPAAPTLFSDEVSGAIRLLEAEPDLGRLHRRAGLPGLRRLLLPRTRYHLYYVHDRASGILVILAVWSAVRGRGPHLRSPRGSASQ